MPLSIARRITDTGDPAPPPLPDSVPFFSFHEMEELLGRPLSFEDTSYHLLPDELREGESKQSFYFPRPTMSLKELVEIFSAPPHFPRMVIPMDYKKESWVVTPQDPGWCRVDLRKHVTAAQDLDPRGQAQLECQGYRAPNVFETFLLFSILRKRKHPHVEMKRILKCATSDYMTDKRRGHQCTLHLIVVLRDSEMHVTPAAWSHLYAHPDDFPYYRAKSE